ncbi:MFS transporter [Nocardiopsis composta]|uniref:MFS family permease n=1 Tax=Nocardiopsis composta TaxID=157465 RepID=A0A7W8QRS3_9ACTN|nr:MFS transporter [Nocardiopsis composta]MBB5434673.1 MFS family permease [Nocardiopsis composta]
MNPTHPDRPDRSSPSTLSDGRKRAVLLTVLLSTLTFPLTITGASLALPDIQADLGAGLSAAQWAVNGYNACFAGFLAVAGSLADVLGRRRVFAGGVTLFFVAGALCGPVGDVLLLNLLRALAGAGAAAAVAGGTSILSETFTGAARARAFGLLGTVLGAGTAFGPTAAGVLVDLLGWRAVFAAPALVAGAVLALCPLLPRLPGAPGRRVDAAGAVSFSAALLLVITVFVEGPERGFGHPLTLGCAAGAVVLGCVFAVVERRTADPMLDLALLADRRFLAYAAAAGAIMAVLIPLLVYLPSYLISVVGLDAGQAGLWLLMLTVPTVLLPSAGARLARAVPPIALVAAAVLLCGAGALLLTGIGPGTGPLAVLPGLVLVGSGAGLTNGILDGLAVGSVPAERAGTAAGVFNTVRITSETVAIATVGALLAALTSGSLQGAAYTSALHTACLALAGFAVLSAAAAPALHGGARTPR